MKTLVLAACLCLVGCVTANSPTPPTAPLIPGAANQFDQDTYRALATAHAFALQAQQNAVQNPISSTQKTILNQFITDLNAADLLYSAYHALQATQAQMQAALNTVKTDQANFSTAGVK
jgi:hypothetical protein